MRSPEVGPFGVVALVLALGVDAAAIGQLLGAGRWGAAVVGIACGRVAITTACRHGVPAARPDGLGALVAGTVPTAVAGVWVAAAVAAAVLLVPGRRLVAAVAVLAGVAVGLLVEAQARRRLGGVTGDVLGACCELATAVALTVLAVAAA